MTYSDAITLARQRLPFSALVRVRGLRYKEGMAAIGLYTLVIEDEAGRLIAKVDSAIRAGLLCVGDEIEFQGMRHRVHRIVHAEEPPRRTMARYFSPVAYVRPLGSVERAEVESKRALEHDGGKVLQFPLPATLQCISPAEIEEADEAAEEEDWTRPLMNVQPHAPSPPLPAVRSWWRVPAFAGGALVLAWSTIGGFWVGDIHGRRSASDNRNGAFLSGVTQASTGSPVDAGIDAQPRTTTPPEHSEDVIVKRPTFAGEPIMAKGEPILAEECTPGVDPLLRECHLANKHP